MAPRSGQHAATNLSPAGLIARTHDPDRFLFALFAPTDRREALFTLIAFNHELARALDVAAGARGEYGGMGGHIRLQWWREVVEGDLKAHEVATPLAALLDQGLVTRSSLLAMIDAREVELDGVPDRDAWIAALRAGVTVPTAELLAIAEPARQPLADLGAAYAIGKMLRHRPTLDRLGRQPMPSDETSSSAITVARTLLASARSLRLPRSQRAASLPAILAGRDLARAASGLDQDHPRSLLDRLAVTAAALTGRSPLSGRRADPP